MKIVDCRNMACPLPVVTVKRALENLLPGEPLQVLLDDGAPRENVTRFAVNRGYSVTGDAESGLTITGKNADDGSGSGRPVAAPPRLSTVMLVASDQLGDGPEELGRLLMKNFIITLLDAAVLPDAIFFLNTGVLLTTEGSEVAETLTELGNRGVEVLSCGVCLDFFHLKDKLAAGVVTNMFSIVEGLTRAGSVIRL